MPKNEPRYIDADKLKSAFEAWTMEPGLWTIEAILDMVIGFPTADVEEVRHGRWIMKDRWITCNCCGCRPYMNFRCIDFDNLFPRCPNCGAKMNQKGEAEK